MDFAAGRALGADLNLVQPDRLEFAGREEFREHKFSVRRGLEIVPLEVGVIGDLCASVVLVDANDIGRSGATITKDVGCNGRALIFLSRLFPTLNTHDG